MYESYYGLNERPFDLSPDPRFLFLSNGHREALAHLQYGLSGRPGVTLLIGEAGTGKTTLVRAALQSSTRAGSQCVHLSNPTLTRQEFLQYLASGFGLTSEAAQSKTVLLRELESAIAFRERESGVLALIVDEGQSLPHALLEEVRLLTNIESSSGRSVAVVLIGQPELATRLNDPSLRQLKQRVALRCQLATLDLKGTAAYIASRIRVAGGIAADLFTRDAVCAIHEYSRGIPRTISVICDNALVNGFAADIKPVTRKLILEVCRDFEIVGPVARTNLARGPSRPGEYGELTPTERDSMNRALAQSESSGDANGESPKSAVRDSSPRRRFSFV
jgi:type II secretory pathway predicted ATPase ExeA